MGPNVSGVLMESWLESISPLSHPYLVYPPLSYCLLLSPLPTSSSSFLCLLLQPALLNGKQQVDRGMKSLAGQQFFS